MCGIYGITKRNLDWVKSYMTKCHYRGPDNYSTYQDENITLGHNLLSITDLPSIGVQPWRTDKGNILIYNGEIFNYHDLCNKYKNFKPKTQCDTELLAWGLDEFGIDFVEQIDSMHAFALWAKKKQQLTNSKNN